MNFPLRHISIRLPWHDAGWNGTVCKCPARSTACLKLANIAEKKNEEAEENLKGKSIRAPSRSAMTHELWVPVQQEMGRRGILRAAVESVLAAPGQRVAEHGDVVCYQSKMEINQKLYLVRMMVK